MNEEAGRRADRFLLYLFVSILCFGGLYILGGYSWGAYARPAAKKAWTEALLNTIGVAMGFYRADHGRYPSSLGELSVLNSRQRKYTDADTSLDAWQHPFVYQLAPDGSATVTSYGRDGRPGGRGYDEDLVLKMVPATQPATQGSPASDPSP